jgi:hypothetical protein
MQGMTSFEFANFQQCVERSHSTAPAPISTADPPQADHGLRTRRLRRTEALPPDALRFRSKPGSRSVAGRLGREPSGETLLLFGAAIKAR